MVETKSGPRILRKAAPTRAFWLAWWEHKIDLKAEGIGLNKTPDGKWKVNWWQELPKEEQEKLKASQLASRATDAQVDLPCPAGLEYLPFQRAGIAYALDRKRVLLGDEMGLGKTIQAIGAINAIPEIKKVLVICPASLRLNWKKELEKWLVRNMSITVIDGGKFSDWIDADIVICNYDVIKKHRKRIDLAGPYALMILDESHKLKNPKTQRTKAIYGDTKSGQKAIKADRVLALTGTPIVNRPIELWPFLQFADPDGLGKSFFGFAKKFCNAYQGPHGWDFSGASNLDQLQRILRQRLMVRRLKADVLSELPAKRRQIIELPANGAARAVAHEQKIAAKWEDDIALHQANVELAKVAADPLDYDTSVENLRQCSKIAFAEMSKVRHQVAMAKLPVVITHLEEALEEGPVVCFAHHRDVISQIAKAFVGRCVTITGEMPMQARQAAVESFQGGEIDLLIGNIQAAGLGITLTRSSHVVFAEGDWVPGNLSQAEDRCHRIGQQGSVLIQHLVLEGSIDAIMIREVVAKQAIIDKALDEESDLPKFVAPTKEKASTADTSRSKLDKAAGRISEEQSEAIHVGLRKLACLCDGARSIDGRGFNKIDARIGRSLAEETSLTRRQAALGQKLIQKYRRQLIPQETEQ